MVVAFSLVGASTQMVWLTFAPVTTVAADRFGVSVTAIGWLANLFVLCFVILAIPAGLLLDRHFKLTLLLGAALTATGASLRLGGDSFEWLLIGGAVAALGQPIILTGIASLTRNYLAPEDRAKGIAMATASTWAGFIAAFALGAMFSGADQIRTLLLVHAAYALVAALALASALRRPAPFAEAGPAIGSSSGLRDIKRVWSDPLIRGLCFFGFIPFGTFIALTTWTEALLEPAGVSVEMVGIILIANVLAGVIGTAILPVWAARRRAEVATGMASISLTAVACVVLAVTPGAAVALIALALAGFLLLPMLAIVLELIERHAGEDEGVASGLVWAVGNLGGLITTGLIGFTVGKPTLSFALMAAITLLALPVLRSLAGPVAALPSGDSRDSPPKPAPTTR